MADSVGVECSVIAFYGVQTAAAAKRALFESTVISFAGLGYAPNYASIHGLGFSNKPMRLSRCERQLVTSGFSNVTSVELYYMPDGKHNFVASPLVKMFYSTNQGTFAIVQIRSNVRRIPCRAFYQLAERLSRNLSPNYGIGYRRDLAQGPSMYAYGIVVGMDDPAEEEEAERIGQWGFVGMNEQQVYLKGELRDVYPWNFLTAPQLTAPVGKVALEQWIRKDTKRGKLTPLTDKMLLWEVEDKHVPAVRETLWDAGRIFDYRKYIEPPPPDWTPEDSLRAVIGDTPPEKLIILDGTGKEIPTSEIKKIVKRGKKKR